jgi:8-oxo-dGTP pyrophosphatase MutT (NUDIX family)
MRARSGSAATRASASVELPRFFQPSQLRALRGVEQVAAVCYRIRNGNVDFLLVQTRGSARWTFPKGCAEPGLTHAQAAALEAFEEAGVHGRMEDVPFAHYPRGQSRKAKRTRNSSGNAAVEAYLCEVQWLGPPQESNRNPTWLSVEKAKRRLRKDRPRDEGHELAEVVDLAVARIRGRRTSQTPATVPDSLQKVQFEAAGAIEMHGRNNHAAFVLRRSALAVNARVYDILQVGPDPNFKGTHPALPARKEPLRLEAPRKNRRSVSVIDQFR